MDLMADPRNYLELNQQQRAAVRRMAGVMLGRPVFWPEDDDPIIHEAIMFRQHNRMHVFPHVELEIVDDEPDPPVPPNTPRIHDLRAPE